ncbi:ClpP class serine protease [Caulobacter sp. BE264]|uniref:S49 family peptidase n=1 Tax=Caulobacter sp. BE264 TaxID=2817724 RepID=UPI00285C0832|nr:S49 family peptidase [Caulobacter sp. BE264]MDR7232288.1 ClpP class serine protease [Caulobacter sp. BE264]
MTNAALLATRYARRPLLLEPAAALRLAEQLRTIDGRAFSRPGRLGAFMRQVGLAFGGRDGASAARIQAMEDDDYAPPPPLEERLAYSPRWAGEVDDRGYCWALKDGIALMQCDTPLVERGEEFCGVVYHGYDTLKAAIADAIADQRVRGLFIRMSSPGGVVAGGLAALAKFMREVRATGNAAGKPIHVHADMACSAAYWISAQADRITAPKVGLVGSIGAVLVHESYEEALKEYGLEVTAIQFGAQKTAGNWWSKLTPEAKADLQAEIDQVGRDFVADVNLGRPILTQEALIGTEARVFLGEHDEAARSGLALGFVDAIRSEEEAFEDLYAEVTPPEPALGAVQPVSGQARDASTSRKETLMAGSAPNQAAQAAQTRKAAALKALSAQRAKIDAEIQALEGETDDEGAEAGAETAAGTGEGSEDDDEDGDKEPKDAPDAPEGASEAEAIAASAEAKANPAGAIAAIQSGLTLAQFKAMSGSGALTASAKRSPLAEAMAGARRLGPDAQAATHAESPLVASARRQREAAKR